MKWPAVKLGSVARIRRGASPRPKGDPRYFGGQIPWLKIVDVPKGSRFVEATEEGVTEAGRDLSVYVEPGTLLLSNSASLGRPVITRIGVCIHEGWLAITEYEKLFEREFLFWFFISAQKELVRLAPAGVQANLNTGLVSGFAAPIPAKKEQRRIVELLEQADALRQKRAEADALADRILPALFHKLFGDPATNSKSFPRIKLGDVITATVYGTSVSANTDAQGIPVLRMSNITTNGRLNLEDLKHVELDDAELRRQMLEPGDLLFNRTNSRELVGKTGLWRGDMPAVAASYLIRVKVDRAKVKPEFVWAWLNTRFIKQQLFEKSRRAVGMANINATELRSLPIILPPLPIQESFIKCLEQIHADIQRRAASNESLQTLFTAMLHRAFTGELTAQWREAHLKELLAEMEQQAKALNLPANGKN